MTKEYCSIVFMHDYEDESGIIPKFFDNEVSEEEMITYLSQWDCGAESEHCLTPDDETPWGLKDNVFPHENYILAWNSGLAYVSLTRIVETPDESLTTIKPAPLTLTPWEAEQARFMMVHYQTIGNRRGVLSTDYAADLEKLISKLDTYIKESA